MKARANGRRSKYGAVKTVCGAGHKHDSKKEAKRCGELQLLQKAGQIRHLTQQPKFDIEVNDVKICTYIGDFWYLEEGNVNQVVEDCKGFRTAIYRLKKKLVEAQYGIEIRES